MVINDVTIHIRAAAPVTNPLRILTTFSLSSSDNTGSSGAAKVDSSQRANIPIKTAAIRRSTLCCLRNNNMLFIRMGLDIFINIHKS